MFSLKNILQLKFFSVFYNSDFKVLLGTEGKHLVFETTIKVVSGKRNEIKYQGQNGKVQMTSLSCPLLISLYLHFFSQIFLLR